MKKITNLKSLFFILLSATLMLASCNKPSSQANQGLDVTQAHQTVEARLTQAVGQTPDSTATLPPDEATPTPTTENISPTETTQPPEPSNTPAPETRCDQAAAAYPKIDITIEDDTEMAPGETFTKVWRVVNAGTCAWAANYAIVLFSGEQMDAPVSLPMNVNVPPGQSLDISVDMAAPEEPGTYQSNWKLRNTEGELFGIGPNGQSPFWVRIKVVAITTETPTPTLTPSLTPEVQASGSVTLVLTDTLDMDNLLVNAGGADLTFQATGDDPPQHQLAPLGGAAIAVFGGGQPTLEDCQTAGLAAAPITVDGLASGTYLCYRTDLALPGWARIAAFSPDDGTITLEIFTWKIP